MYRLYWDRATAAAGPRMVLEAAGLPYELCRVDLARGGHRAPA